MTRYLVYSPVAPDVDVIEQSPRSTRPFRESRGIAFHNGKQHAREAMLQILDQLSNSYGVINLGGVERPTSSAADPAVLDQLARECDWAIVGACD